MTMQPPAFTPPAGGFSEGGFKVRHMDKKQESLYRKSVMRAHNIEITDNGFMCNDGDTFKNVWEALEHTIWLDLSSRHIKYETGKNPLTIDRNCNDYYEIMEERPSAQSKEEES